MARPLHIALDGPASSGKGTVARLVARTLSYAYVDTGAMYRCVGLAAIRAGLSLTDGPAVGALAACLQIGFTWRGQEQRVLLDGVDVSETIRQAAIGRAASDVAVLPEVRAALLEGQRALGRAGGVVMDGRDIGTVVLPDAELKIYLDAHIETRAARRRAELAARGQPAAFEEVLAELRARDSQDSGRTTAPLRRAEDAILLDTSDLSPEEAAHRICAMARARIDAAASAG